MVLRTASERKTAGAKIVREAEQLGALFGRVAPDLIIGGAGCGTPLEAISALAEILRSDDKEILSLDLTALVNKFPDIKEEHVIKLVGLRGDVSRSEIRELVTYIFQAARNSRQTHASVNSSIFAQIPV